MAHVAQANGCQLTYNWQIGVCAPYNACTKACTNHSGVEGGIRRKAGSLQAPLVDANVSIALPNIFLLTFYTPHILSSILQSSQFDPFLYFFTHHYFSATKRILRRSSTPKPEKELTTKGGLSHGALWKIVRGAAEKKYNQHFHWSYQVNHQKN